MPDELFCERLKRVRLALGMSQSGLAAILDTTWHTIQNWELGRTTPRFQELPRLYNRINARTKLSAEWFLLGFGPAPDLPPHSPIHRAIHSNAKNGCNPMSEKGENLPKSFRT